MIYAALAVSVLACIIVACAMRSLLKSLEWMEKNL